MNTTRNYYKPERIVFYNVFYTVTFFNKNEKSCINLFTPVHQLLNFKELNVENHACLSNTN